MTRPWTAEYEVSPLQARRLIAGQFPALTPVEVEPFGAGWDNTAYLVNRAYVFRFPRRPAGAACLAAEVRVLPGFASTLPWPITVPTLIGQPEEDFPWPFAGYRMLPGRPACQAVLDDAQRFRAARPLAHFLAALHSIGADRAERLGAGGDDIGRLDIGKRTALAGEHLRRLGEFGLIADVTPWLDVVDEVLAEYPDLSLGSEDNPWPRATRVLVHGDLYARHVLVDRAGLPCGVIDWGDVHLGHPAVDLAIAHTFLPGRARDEFCAADGPISSQTLRLARLRAVYHTAMLVLYGCDIDDQHLVREGLTSLHHIVAV